MVGLWHAAAATAISWAMARNADVLHGFRDLGDLAAPSLGDVQRALTPLWGVGLGIVAIALIAFVGGGALAMLLTRWEHGKLPLAASDVARAPEPTWTEVLADGAVTVTAFGVALAAIASATAVPFAPRPALAWVLLGIAVWSVAIVRAAFASLGLAARIGHHRQRADQTSREQRRQRAARKSMASAAYAHDRVTAVMIDADHAIVQSESGTQRYALADLDAALALARRDNAPVTYQAPR